MFGKIDEAKMELQDTNVMNVLCFFYTWVYYKPVWDPKVGCVGTGGLLF